MSKDKLAEYRSKRDTSASGEPAGRREKKGGGDLFVVQRHDASTLHFDFRLEVDGVLVSWSVPKGPSLDPRDKRLAVRTEDHPVDYADFEGRIGAGYGEGTVVVWDTGTHRNLTGVSKDEPVGMAKAVEDGHLTVWLDGQKLSGAFSMTRTGTGRQEKWIFVKKDDEGADRRATVSDDRLASSAKPARTKPESVLSGHVNEDFE
jgi:DNA ligase D-like protein (predicted 3'-phosphoesterase)